MSRRNAGYEQCIAGAMDHADALRIVTEAHGFAELEMYREAWDTIERLPAIERLSPQAVAVRLLVCAGVRNWEMGIEFASLIRPGFPLPVRAAAGLCYLARAKTLDAGGDLAGAREAARALLAIWPEGSAELLKSAVRPPAN